VNTSKKFFGHLFVVYYETLMARKSLSIAVIIPAFNEATYIADCLKAIGRQTRPADLVIVVDNNCTDDTVAIARQFPFVRVVHETHQGLTHARNRGFDEAASQVDILCRTDADGRPSANWLAVIESAFAADPHLVGLTGRMKVYGSRLNLVFLGLYMSVYGLTRLLLGGKEYLRGPNTALRSSVWPQLRQEVTLDDALVHEDMDLSVRLSRMGKLGRTPRMRVAVHVRTIRKSPRAAVEYTRRWLRTRRHLRRIKVL
jgi:glycosyltransferase involved in cell wall biosynthesis